MCVRRSSVAVLLLSAGLLGALPAHADDIFDGRASFEPAAAPGDRSLDTLILRTREGASGAEIDAALSGAGVVETLRQFTLVPGLRVVRVAPGMVDVAIGELSKHAAVQYAEPDYLVSALVQTTEYGVTHVGAPAVWSAIAGSAGRGGGVRIAVLDTGVDLLHPDLPVPVQSASFVPGQAVDDLHTHGTHCSGLVLARDNDIGVVGVAPSADLMIGKVLGNSGSGQTSWVMAGNEWAAQNGARVISMSLGGGGFSQGQQDLQNALRTMGVIVFAAAGNDNSGELFYPASYDGVVSVALLYP
ncbi:MAG: S8 family serine peptidase [Phycisphaerales bacterium]